jgi:hypothetical protein
MQTEGVPLFGTPFVFPKSDVTPSVVECPSTSPEPFNAFTGTARVPPASLNAPNFVLKLASMNRNHVTLAANF